MKKEKNVYQLKIQVKRVKPSIYRTILVDEDVSFIKLHKYIQSVFGLMGYHLWQFSGKFKNPFSPSPEFCIAPKDEEEWKTPEYYADETKLCDIFTTAKQKLEYWYDFGDDWIFEVMLQKIIPKSELSPKIQKLPHLLKAKGPMLMEDVGGIHYWEEIIGLYKHLKAGKTLAGIDEKYLEDLSWKVVGELAEDKNWTEIYIDFIEDLFEEDWDNFDIEADYMTLKD